MEIFVLASPQLKQACVYKMVVYLSVCSAGEKPTPLLSIKFAKNILDGPMLLHKGFLTISPIDFLTEKLAILDYIFEQLKKVKFLKNV